jgi:hypothetical protein
MMSPEQTILFPGLHPSPTVLGSTILKRFSSGELLDKGQLQARLPSWHPWHEVQPELRRLVRTGHLLGLRSKGWRRPGLSDLQLQIREALDPLVWLSTRQVQGALDAPPSLTSLRLDLAHLVALGWAERGQHRGRERWRRR